MLLAPPPHPTPPHPTLTVPQTYHQRPIKNVHRCRVPRVRDTKTKRMFYVPHFISQFSWGHKLAFHHLTTSDLPFLFKSAAPLPHGIHNPDASSPTFVFDWKSISHRQEFLLIMFICSSLQLMEVMFCFSREHTARPFSMFCFSNQTHVCISVYQNVLFRQRMQSNLFQNNDRNIQEPVSNRRATTVLLSFFVISIWPFAMYSQQVLHNCFVRVIWLHVDRNSNKRGSCCRIPCTLLFFGAWYIRCLVDHLVELSSSCKQKMMKLIYMHIW